MHLVLWLIRFLSRLQIRRKPPPSRFSIEDPSVSRKEYFFSLAHQLPGFIFTDLKLIQIETNAAIEVKFAVVQQAAGRIGVPVDNGDFVYPQTLKPHRAEKSGRSGSDNYYIISFHFHKLIAINQERLYRLNN